MFATLPRVPRSLPRFPSVKGAAAPSVPQNVLRFLSSGDSPADVQYAIRFANPHLNGLPIWGPSNAGVTTIVERWTRSQTGYYGAAPWWSNGGAFVWAAGGTDTDSYWGPCPFPPGGTGTPVWELSGMFGGKDNIINLSGGNIAMNHGTRLTQGLRITRNGNSTKTGRFYPYLPSTANANVIVGPDSGEDNTAFGETNPPNPVVQFGDSPWTDFDKERFAGDLGRIKIIAKVLSEADLLSEAADMSRLVTSDGIANIWWGKKNWLSVDDLTCDYGTGRTFAWVDSSHKATLALAA